MYKKFIELLNFSHGKYRQTDIFRDFVALFAISLSNAFLFREELENRYLQIINQYTKEEMQVFPRLVAELVHIMCLKQTPYDVLGDIYQIIGANSKALDQYFTPFTVSRLMAALCIPKEKNIDKDKIITIHEPCSRKWWYDNCTSTYFK